MKVEAGMVLGIASILAFLGSRPSSGPLEFGHAVDLNNEALLAGP